VNLYLRLLKVLFGLFFVRRRGLLETSSLRFRAWPNDLDLNMHVNNGRYLTFMDLGRVHLLAQLGLLGEVVRRGWQPVLSAAEINFIRPIGPFRRFTLTTRLIAWDEKYFYIEHRFMRADILCAVATVRGLFLARGSRVTPAQAIELLKLDAAAPAMPAVVQRWNELMDLKKEQTARP
jgi:acyl-CoA thioesterase FadM